MLQPSNITRYLKECDSPVMVFIKKGETASPSSNIKLRVFNSKDGYKLVTNLSKPTSLASEEKLTEVANVSESTTIKALLSDDGIAEMTTDDGATVYVDAALAFDLSGLTIINPLTGKLTTIDYAEDDMSDSTDSEDDTSTEDDSSDSEDDSSDSEDMSEDDTSSEDDSSESEDDSAGSEDDSSDSEEATDSEDDSEDTSDTSTDEDTPDSEDDSSTEDDPTDSEDDTSSEDDSSDSEDDSDILNTTEDDTSSEETSKKKCAKKSMASDDTMSEDDEEDPYSGDMEDNETVDIDATDLADPTRTIKLVSLTNDGSDFAVFSGENHIGSLHSTDASESAASLYSNSSKLYAAFKPSLINAMKTGEYASLNPYGFKPVRYSVKISEIASKHIERECASAIQNTAAETASTLERDRKILALATLGLAKGAFDKQVSFIDEIANVLTNARVPNASEVVRDIVAKNSEKFVKAVFEVANDLRGNTDDYLTGIGETIRKASFTKTSAVNPGKVTTIYARPEVASEETIVGAISGRKINRFEGMVKNLGRRH